MNDGFFSSLFDFSFDKLVTIKVMKVLYALAVLGLGLWAGAFLFVGLGRGGGAAFAALIISVLGFILGVVMVRIYLEVVVVLFRILENVKGINLSLTGPGAAAPTTQAPPPVPPGTEPGTATT